VNNLSPLQPTSEISDIEQQKMDINIAKYIMKSKLPLSHIDSKGFKDFCKLLIPNYDPPSKQTLKKI